MTHPSDLAGTPSALERLEEWMEQIEGEHFEFKEAKTQFSFEELCKCACASANEEGGKILLGVTNRRPRRVVGTQAFPQPEETRRALMDRVPVVIDVEVIQHSDGRVLVFSIQARPIGTPIKYDGVYWSRDADSLVPLSEDRLRLIFAEAGRDFSAEVCRGATMADLNPVAIEEFRRRWIDKSKNGSLVSLSQEQVLRDAELLVAGGFTYAAIILLGTRGALGRLLSQAEVVFEYRSSESAGPAQQRSEFREGFFGFYDALWNAINLRNDMQHYQEGLFVFDIPTFDERSVREALLNAVSHRDYQLGGNVFVRQYARRLVIESPGGWRVGINEQNVLYRQSPRNRRIAEVLAKCGLVDRSGQGMNLMFERSIRYGKARPEFVGSEAYHVVFTLHGQVRDPRFVRFLQQISQEAQATFGTDDFLLLDLLQREESVPRELQPRLGQLIDLGVIERIGRGKGIRYLLSRRFYSMVRKKGAYTRRIGLDHETSKELLLKHLRENSSGSPLSELQEVLPHLGSRKVQSLLSELRTEGSVRVEGSRRWARWKLSKSRAEPESS